MTTELSKRPGALDEESAGPDPVPTRKRRRRRWLVDVHNFLGGLAGVAVIVMSVTGIVLNHVDLLGLAGSAAHTPGRAAGAFLPVDDVADRAGRHVAGNDAPGELDRAVWRLGDGIVEVRLDTKPPTEVTVDARTGDVLGTAERHDLEVAEAHSGEILGKAWVVLSDLTGVALVVALVSGVWIWVRRVRARGRLVGARPGSAWPRANWWFHLVGGLVAAVLLVVLSVTGVLLNHKKDFRLMADPPNLPDHRDDSHYTPLPVEELIDAAIGARGSSYSVTDVKFVDYRPKGYAKVRFRDSDREVIVDAADGTPIEKSRRWDVWVEDLHTGLFFGSRGWLLSDLGAVLAILLTVNGVYLWLTPAWRARNRSEVRS